MSDVAISADGVPIHYEVYGQRDPALVFVHGWSCDRSYWQNQLGQFASRYTVCAIDLAGHGESGLNRTTWTMPAFGQDVVAVVETLNLAQVVLVGHSLGGTVIVEAARQMPNRVAGLVGIDTYRNLGQRRTKAEIKAFLSPFRNSFREATEEVVRTSMFVSTSKAALVETIAQDMAAAPPQVGIGASVAAFGHDAELQAALQALHVPIHAINADYHPTDLEAARRYGIHVMLMAGVGHFVMIEDPETFNDLLEQTIKRILAAVPQV